LVSTNSLPGTAWTTLATLESGFFHLNLSVRRNSCPTVFSSRPVSIHYVDVSIRRRLMRTGRKMGPLLLGLFVGLSIIAAMGVSPAYAKGTGPTYSCTVSVTYTTNTFYVKTTVTASGGYLPGPSENDNVKAYVNGVLYNTQSSTYSIGTNVASTTVTIPVSSNGSGSYTFQSAILNSKGVQLASCTGTYTL
jgi:hypothetical protein